MSISNLEERFANAINYFWDAKSTQQTRQGGASGAKDAGTRGSVTAGKHLDGIRNLVRDVLVENTSVALSDIDIKTTLPGFFRATKNWDLLVIHQSKLLAIIELKSHVGSFGNNFNNRVEEALGNATDLWTAYRESVFPLDEAPWLGWMMLVQDNEGSRKPVGVREPHYEVIPEYKNASYAKRYEIFCEKLIRERLYSAACLVLSDDSDSSYLEPRIELSFRRFLMSLVAHINHQISRDS